MESERWKKGPTELKRPPITAVGTPPTNTPSYERARHSHEGHFMKGVTPLKGVAREANWPLRRSQRMGWPALGFFPNPWFPRVFAGFPAHFRSRRAGQPPSRPRKPAPASPVCPVSATGIRGATVTILTSGRRSLLPTAGFGGPERNERFFVPRCLW